MTIELMTGYLGLDNRPRTNSEVDIMEWFASLDEDDWEALLDMNEDMDAEGCGPVRHDTNGAEGPREREDELEYNSPPGQINGGSGGNDGCAGNFATFSDCYYAFIDAGYDYDVAQEDCTMICASYGPGYEGEFDSDACYHYCNIGGCISLCAIFGTVISHYTTPAGGLIASIGCGISCQYLGCPELCDHLT